MHGPNVNWFFYDEVVKNRGDGAASVYKYWKLWTIYGSFKTVIEVTDWNIKATAKCAFQILHDAPARMADYTSVSGSSIFFLFFCATRWVEDRKVAKRLLEIWLHNSKVVAFWL